MKSSTRVPAQQSARPLVAAQPRVASRASVARSERRAEQQVCAAVHLDFNTKGKKAQLWRLGRRRTRGVLPPEERYPPP